MRRFLSTLMILAVAMVAAAQTRVINHPWFDICTDQMFRVEKVEVNDTATVLTCVRYMVEDGSFTVSPNSFIMADGQKLAMKFAEGLTPGNWVEAKEGDLHEMRLFFPPVGKKVKNIDFLEGYGDGQFQVWGIRLDKSKPNRRTSESRAELAPAMPSEKEEGEANVSKQKAIKTNAVKTTSLPLPAWKIGTGTLCGHIVGYRPEMGTEVTVMPYNLFSESQYDEIKVKVESNGSFRCDVPMYATHQSMRIIISRDAYADMVVLTQGDTCRLTYDLVENTHLFATGEEYMKARIEAVRNRTFSVDKIYFSGAFADVNNALHSPEARKCLYNYFATDESNLPAEGTYYSLEEYYAKLRAWNEKQLSEIDALNISPAAKQVLSVHHRANLLQSAQWGNKCLQQDEYGGVKLDEGFIVLMKDLDLDNMNIAYSPNYCIISNLTMPTINSIEPMHTDWMTAINKVGRFDTQLFDVIGDSVALDYLTQKGFDPDGPLCEALRIRQCQNFLDDDTPFNELLLKLLNKSKNTVVCDYLLAKNEELKATLAERKSNVKHTIHDTPQTDGEQALADICKEFAGKPIFIDFWGTWCAPCRSAIKEFEAHKHDLMQRGLEVLYITDEQSPEDIWRKMISTMDGHHYRLTEKQADDIFTKFGFDGWPSYLVIDKQGNIILQRTGYVELKILEAINKSLTPLTPSPMGEGELE